MVTREYLQAERDKLVQERGQLVANVNAYNGGIQAIDRLIAADIEDETRRQAEAATLAAEPQKQEDDHAV